MLVAARAVAAGMVPAVAASKTVVREEASRAETVVKAVVGMAKERARSTGGSPHSCGICCTFPSPPPTERARKRTTNGMAAGGTAPLRPPGSRSSHSRAGDWARCNAVGTSRVPVEEGGATEAAEMAMEVAVAAEMAMEVAVATQSRSGSRSRHRRALG